MPDPITLRTVMATSPLTEPLKHGSIGGCGVHLDFVDVEPVHKAFAPMVREQAYDLSELAIVTALQAVAYGKPIILLPVVLASRFQRGCLITRRTDGVNDPSELRGKRVGVRAYTQTTGMWVRAHLAGDYGLATSSIRWLTRDPAHVAEFKDPSFVEHADDDKNLLDQLRQGITDAAILGNDLPSDGEFTAVIADAGARDRDWYAAHGFVPTNHVLSASSAAVARHPGAVRETYELLARSFHQMGTSRHEPSRHAIGFDALVAPVQYVIDACLEQGLLPRRLTLDDVFGPARALLAGVAT